MQVVLEQEGFKEFLYDDVLLVLRQPFHPLELVQLQQGLQITVSSGANNGVIDYVYAADKTKLQKKKTQGGVTTTTEYIGDYVYENGTLKQITQPEGYIEPDGQGGYWYVYRYVDIWGNTRLTYADDDHDGNIDLASEIRREQNYYPFGLEHKGYNNVSYGVKNNLKTYQGQEFTEDLGLNTHEWKYRVSDPAIGRFWQIDPLAEDYTYNSPYAFQENRLGMGIELEGAEALGWDVAQNLIQRTSNILIGSNKMVTGGSNMLSEAMSGKTAERMANENGQALDVLKPQIDSNFEMVLDGAAQIDEALPDKQDVRNAADTAELVGDAMVMASPFTGPAALGTAVTGGTIGTIGFLTNLSLDLIEGDVKGAFIRVTIEGASTGMGSMVKQVGGDKVANN